MCTQTTTMKTLSTLEWGSSFLSRPLIKVLRASAYVQLPSSPSSESASRQIMWETAAAKRGSSTIQQAKASRAGQGRAGQDRTAASAEKRGCGKLAGAVGKQAGQDRAVATRAGLWQAGQDRAICAKASWQEAETCHSFC